jgi:NADP-dependent 3-hydroxy acid dehydrogenase YdfG/acyl dehydratase/acyl carrier protein
MSTALQRVCFSNFCVGDHFWFDRTFSAADFEAFTKLSGDRNRLHHDAEHARKLGYPCPIVPLHMAALPLSSIAGMGFPGEPSLYLWHELRATAPIFYGDTVTYSARIQAINRSHRVLTLSVLGLRSSEVVFEGGMSVRSTEAEWNGAVSFEIQKEDRSRVALITGAAGAVGSAVAESLLRAGWRLLLLARGTGAADLRERFHNFEERISVHEADLSEVFQLRSFLQQAATGVDLLVHAASPALNAGLDSLIAVNYGALRTMVDTLLPGMLRRQSGHIVFIGSSAVQDMPMGWDDYVAAKVTAQSVINQIETKYSCFGVRGLTVAPGFIESRFSDGWRPDAQPTLLPEEVAEKLLAAVETRQGGYLCVQVGRVRQGIFAPTFALGTQSAVAHAAAPTDPADGCPDALGESEDIASVVRSVLKLAPDFPLEQAALGDCPGWDSLRHIQLILELERRLGIGFLSDEMDQTRSYEGLLQLCSSKLAFLRSGSTR